MDPKRGIKMQLFSQNDPKTVPPSEGPKCLKKGHKRKMQEISAKTDTPDPFLRLLFLQKMPNQPLKGGIPRDRPLIKILKPHINGTMKIWALQNSRVTGAASPNHTVRDIGIVTVCMQIHQCVKRGVEQLHVRAEITKVAFVWA